ncbi:MAG: hypothetical protein WCH85_06910 [Methanomicrobiales archaeon]
MSSDIVSLCHVTACLFIPCFMRNVLHIVHPIIVLVFSRISPWKREPFTRPLFCFFFNAGPEVWLAEPGLMHAATQRTPATADSLSGKLS